MGDGLSQREKEERQRDEEEAESVQDDPRIVKQEDKKK